MGAAEKVQFTFYLFNYAIAFIYTLLSFCFDHQVGRGGPSLFKLVYLTVYNLSSCPILRVLTTIPVFP